MKPLPILLMVLVPALLAPSASPAADPKGMLLTEEPPIIAAPDLKQPLDGTWQVVKGTYTVKEGLLSAAELPADKHVAVIWHNVGLRDAVMECEFRWNGSKALIIGCDGTTPKGGAHVGRVVIVPHAISVAEDSVNPSHTIATTNCEVKPGEWHHLRVEWKGDEMAARVDEHEVRARHDYLATLKVRSWIAVAGATTEFRHLTIRGVKQ